MELQIPLYVVSIHDELNKPLQVQSNTQQNYKCLVRVGESVYANSILSLQLIKVQEGIVNCRAT